jgi:hypothetical protein
MRSIKGVRPMAAQLFMGSFARPSKENFICTSKPTTPSCGSALCAVGCDERIINSCASGKSCAFDCDNADSDDGVFENIRKSTISDNSASDSNSSEEDFKDALEDLANKSKSITDSPEKKAKFQDFKNFIKNDYKKIESSSEEAKKKARRQKGDADSLKKYAYGKLIYFSYYSTMQAINFDLTIICRPNINGPWKNGRRRLQR